MYMYTYLLYIYRVEHRHPSKGEIEWDATSPYKCGARILIETGFGFRVSGFGLRVSGFGFRVSG